MITLLYFGRLSDRIGCQKETIPLPRDVSNTTELRRWLDHHHDAGGNFLEETVRIAINDRFVQEPIGIKSADEIAFMPPVSGG